MIEGAEEIRHEQRDQIDGRERTRRRDAKGDAWPVRIAEKLHREQGRNEENGGDYECAERQRAEPRPEIGQGAPDEKIAKAARPARTMQSR